MRKTGNLVKLALGLLVVLFALASCADEVKSANNSTVSIGISTDPADSKGLVADYGKLTETDYYWFYKTSVTNAQGTPYVVESQTIWPSKAADGKGLSGSLTYGVGDWTLELWAYKTSDSNAGVGLAYYGKAKINVTVDKVYGNVIEATDIKSANGDNGYRVYVPMQYVDRENNDDNVPFTGEEGTILYAYTSVTTFDKDSSDALIAYKGNQDAIYTWSRYTTISDIGSGTPVVKSQEGSHNLGQIDGVDYVSVTDLPSSYSIETLYDSLGVFYKVIDTVDIHSNKTVKITGNFENRTAKKFKVYFHDGKILNSNGSVNTSSTIAFTGDLTEITKAANKGDFKDFDGTEEFLDETGTPTNVPYMIYTFEDDIILPWRASTTNSDFKKGYGFWGWYVTDTNWLITDTDWTTDTQNCGLFSNLDFVRTSGTTQTIFVSQTSDGLENADANFENAYGLLISSVSAADKNDPYTGVWNSADYVYEIHLFARWVELTKEIGAYTTNSDSLTLYDTKFGIFGGVDGYVHLTIVEGVDRVQGFTTYSELKFYSTDGNLAYTTASSFTDGSTYTEYSLDGFYLYGNPTDGKADTDYLLLTNEGVLSRNSNNVAKYIDEDGLWKSQNGTELYLVAHWRAVEKVK
jgi:hypothetical protein